MTDPKPAAETPPRCPPCECGAAYGHTLGCVRRDRAMLDFTCSICKRVHPDPAPAASLSPSPAPRCTGLTATWCPIHGVCRCEKNGAGEPSLDDERCALHSTVSEHADDEPAPAAAPALPQGPGLREIERDLQFFGDCEFRRGLWEANHRKSSEAHRAESLKFRASTLDLVRAALSRERTAREQAERERDLAARSALANLDHAAEVETQRAAAESTAQRERERAEALAGALAQVRERTMCPSWITLGVRCVKAGADHPCLNCLADAALAAYEADKGTR